MLSIISPSKTQETIISTPVKTSQCLFANHSAILLAELQKLNVAELQTLMKMSEKLAEENYKRYQEMSFPINKNCGSVALFTFKGDVYNPIDAASYSDKELRFCQDHLCILSGLYGIIRPLDIILPYRLEMGLKWRTPQWKSLYSFWREIITAYLLSHMKQHNQSVLLNLASNEYFKTIDRKAISAKIVTPVFKDHKNGKLKTVAIYAKKARGKMIDYIIQNKITAPDKLKRFHRDGYTYSDSLSDDSTMVFTR